MDVVQTIFFALLICVTQVQGHSRPTVSEGNPDFNLQPARIVVRPQGGVITITGKSNVPLRSCVFVLPNKQSLDFSQGRTSPKTAKYSYQGRGLQVGDCGLTLTNFYPDLVGLSGLIECRVRKEGSELWESNVVSVRVTVQSPRHLPVFDITPKRSRLQKGDNITIMCNARKAIDFCHFFLPGGRNLTFDMGPRTPATPQFRYHGAGLQAGACGVTLTRVEETLRGQVLCKVGKQPVNGDGPWDIAAMKINVAGPRNPGSDQPVTSSTPRIEPATPATPSPGQGVSVAPPVTVPTVVQTTAQGSDCGTISPRGTNIVPLINFGEETFPGQWPWHVAIYRRNGGQPSTYACGGSLISLKAIITAAHCVAATNGTPLNISAVTIFAGKYFLQHNPEDVGRQEGKAQRILVHPDYNLQAGLLNDIAVVIMTNPFTASQFVKPVCLWDSANSNISAVVGRGGIVVGWGRDEEGQLTEELMMATMPVVSFETCIESNPQHFSAFTRRTTYCAGFRNGTSACNGDSGGGMVFSTRQGSKLTWYLRGVVSNSLRKENELICDAFNYVVFTDVPQYKDWIANTTHNI